MGLLSGLLGNASQADVADTEEALARILADGERVEQAFRLVRDMLIFTDRRLILVDRQGVTGRKAEYHSVPYRAITQFSVESAGALDLEAELKVWVSSLPEPIRKQFTRGSSIYDVQKALAAHVK
jgi:hypothetical protein